MVKNSKKPKNQPQSPTPPQRSPNKYSMSKSTKKSEKSKASAMTASRGLPKSKAQLQQAQRFVDVDPPCTSKQAIAIATGSMIRPKSPTKSPWGGIWKRAEKKKDLTTLSSRKQARTQRKRSPVQKPTPSSSPRQTPDSSPVEDASAAGDDAEVSSLFRSGVIRYADVVRSKNVSSSASLKPPVIILPPPSTPASTAPNDVTAIDLEYFPELGQHKSWQSSSGGSSGSVSKKTTVVAGDKGTTPTTPDSPNSKLESNDHVGEDVLQTDANITPDAAAEQTAPSMCPQCYVNAQWLERVIQNSAKPFRIHIPEYNFLQPDLAYPRFLMQFEDENYLKAENMALLGLKLALGGNFHRHHTTTKY